MKSHPDNVEVVWRFAKASYHYAEAQTDKNVKRLIIFEGIFTFLNKYFYLLLYNIIKTNDVL